MEENKNHLKIIKDFFTNINHTDEEKIQLFVSEKSNLLEEMSEYIFTHKEKLNNKIISNPSTPIEPFIPYQENIPELFSTTNALPLTLSQNSMIALNSFQEKEELSVLDETIIYCDKPPELVQIIIKLYEKVDQYYVDFDEKTTVCKLNEFVDVITNQVNDKPLIEQIDNQFKQLTNKGFNKEFLTIVDNICYGYYLSFLKLEAKKQEPKISFEDYVGKFQNLPQNNIRTYFANIHLYAIYCRIPSFIFLVNPKDKYCQSFFKKHSKKLLEMLEGGGNRIFAIRKKKLPEAIAKALPPINKEFSDAYKININNKRKRNNNF